MRKFCITGDIKKAFLQIRVDEKDRDAQRILWYDNLASRNVTEYRFTRVIFGARPVHVSLERHYRSTSDITRTAQALLEDTYVDDIQGGGNEVADAVTFKEESIKILSEGGFSLHKWHSNVAGLNSSEKPGEEETYAKALVGHKENSETKVLGTLWNKTKDTLAVDFKTCLKVSKPLTKRKIISAIKSVYDVLGWSAPVTITAKLIFSEVCLLKLHWDEEVPNEVRRKWDAWVTSLQKAPTVTVPRCVFRHQRTHFEVHGF